MVIRVKKLIIINFLEFLEEYGLARMRVLLSDCCFCPPLTIHANYNINHREFDHKLLLSNKSFMKKFVDTYGNSCEKSYHH